ncbi:hypothetical protein Dimus_002594, partial [Dionaea muscipula]
RKTIGIISLQLRRFLNPLQSPPPLHPLVILCTVRLRSHGSSLHFDYASPNPNDKGISFIRLSRRQFLVCGLTFRNPPLRSRRKGKKVPRTRIVAASVDSEQILITVAAAATLSAAAAAALLYFNYYLITQKKIKAEVIATFPITCSVIPSWI